ncbi:MAG: hypothetical protein JO287_03255 [Pseudonocardiales bacterium]|nr:hypothetical protein [Pseudonocardiales bacterium]
MQPLSDLDVGVVDVRIFWFSSARETGTQPRVEDWPQGPIVINRVMAYGPLGASKQGLPRVPSAYPGEHDFQNAFDDYVAKKLVGPAWKKSSEVWITPACENVAAVADRISNMHDQWHDVVLGKPVQYLTGQPPLADIATELALPGDTWFTGIKRLLQVSGILFGLASGQPFLANACLKSLVHDILLKVASREIGYLITDTMESAGTRERDLEADKAKNELTRQATELKQLLTIEEQPQRTIEKLPPKSTSHLVYPMPRPAPQPGPQPEQPGSPHLP